jgi:hypothetical protein
LYLHLFNRKIFLNLLINLRILVKYFFPFTFTRFAEAILVKLYVSFPIYRLYFILYWWRWNGRIKIHLWFTLLYFWMIYVTFKIILELFIRLFRFSSYFSTAFIKIYNIRDSLLHFLLGKMVEPKLNKGVLDIYFN